MVLNVVVVKELQTTNLELHIIYIKCFGYLLGCKYFGNAWDIFYRSCYKQLLVLYTYDVLYFISS